ncbi:MAG: hypothetical protein V4808_07240 [Pseudomonadota bacterium]
MTAPVILVEAHPRRTDTGAGVTVRLAGGGGSKPYHYSGAHWQGGLSGLPRIVAMIDFRGDDLGIGGVPQAMSLRWGPSRSAALAELAAYHWLDAAITVRVGPEGAFPPVLLAGKILEAPIAEGVMTLALSDPAADLKKPLLTARFAGTGGVEGPVEWEGRIKSRVWGRRFNIEGDPIDPANNVYCYGDPAKAWQSIDAVRDKGAPAAALVLLLWQGSVSATFAALQAVAAPAGGGVVCPSIACIKWWTQPAGALCADVHGEIGAGYVETAAEIVERIVGVVAAVPFAPGTVADAVAARPAPVGWRVNDDTTTAADVVEKLLGDVSLVWVLEAGEIILRRWEWGASVASAHSLDVTRKASFRPVGRRKLGYRKNEHVMSRDALAGIVLVSDISLEDGTLLGPADIITSLGTSNDTAHVGGVPAGEIVQRTVDLRADLIALETDAKEKLDAARVEIQRVEIETEASTRQLGRDQDRVAEAALRAALGTDQIRKRMSDAGIYVDPDTGNVRIYGVDQAAGRLSEVTVLLDAALAQITLRATSSWVSEQIALAVLTPTQVAELTPILARLTNAEVTLSGLTGQVALKADAVTVGALSALVATLGVTVDALAGEIEFQVTTSQFEALAATVTSIETSLVGLGNVAGITTNIRRAEYGAEEAAASALGSLLAGDKSGQRALRAATQIQQELTVAIVDGLSAEAVARLALSVRMAAAEAGLISEQQVRASTDASHAQSLLNLFAEISSLVGTLNAQVTRLDTADANGAAASAAALAIVEARIDGFEGDVAADVLRLDTADADALEASATANAALHARIDGTEASITDVMEVAAGADGTAKAVVGVAINVDGKISGTKSENDGETSTFDILADVFRISSSGDGARTEYSDGHWRIYDADDNLRVRIGVWS